MKKFTVVLLAGILAMGLAGCSLETEKAPEEQTSVSVAEENKDMETKPESDTQADTGRKVGFHTLRSVLDLMFPRQRHLKRLAKIMDTR